MFDFDGMMSQLQFGKKIKAHGKYWHYVANARHVFGSKDSQVEYVNSLEGEYVIAAPYGSELPCPLSLIFVPGVQSEVDEG